MDTRRLGSHQVPAFGFGCMNLSHAYGEPDPATAQGVLHAAVNLGVAHFDTAALYGFGRNEELVGAAVQRIAIEENVGALADLVRAGSVRAIALSEGWVDDRAARALDQHRDRERRTLSGSNAGWIDTEEMTTEAEV